MPAPTLNSLTAAGDNSYITVAWTNEGTYTEIEMWRKVGGSAWAERTSWTGDPVDREAWDDHQVSPGITYGYKLRGYESGWSDFSNILYITLTGDSYEDSESETIELGESTSDQHSFGNISTETIELSESSSDSATLSDTTTDSIILFDDVGDVHRLTLETDYGYYFGGFNGKIYYENEGYESDDDTAISAYWLSKETDFADMDSKALSRFKTVYGIKLFYMDKTPGQRVTASITTDGGTTWESRERDIGTGDGKLKIAKFDFIKHGYIFQFKVEHNADSGRFQWLNLEVDYALGGEYFEI